jgi:sugar lactone lactonase YvrE
MRKLPVILGLWLAAMASAAEKSGKNLDPKDFPTLRAEVVEEIAEGYRLRPDDPSVVYQVASLHARAGHRQEALDLLMQLLKSGAGLDPDPRDFGTLADDMQFKRIKATIRARNPAVLRARLAYQIGEADLVPEGIAYSERTKKLYFGSMKRKIMSLSPDGKYEEFASPKVGGLGVVLGVRVDDKRGELWAVSNAVDGNKPEPDMVLGLFRFSLADGKLIKAYPVAGADKEMLNDVAVAKDGSVYATASTSGALWRVDPASGKTEKFLPEKSLPSPNGIFATPDGKYVFVAGWYGITRVELKNKKTLLLEKPDKVADGCLDGMYLYKDSIVGIQNCNDDPGRVIQFTLTPDGSRITAAKVLESYNAMFDGVTTAAIAGDDLYFAANAQIAKKPGDKFDDIKVLRLNLK